MSTEERRVVQILCKAFDFMELFSYEYEKLEELCPEHYELLESYEDWELDEIDYDIYVTPIGKTIVSGEITVVIYVPFGGAIDDESEDRVPVESECEMSASYDAEFIIALEENDRTLWTEIELKEE